MWYALLLLKEDFKENCKENDIVQKGGVSEKNQILNVLLKVTFYLGRELIKTNVIFSKCFLTHHFQIFQLILLHLDLNF